MATLHRVFCKLGKLNKAQLLSNNVPISYVLVKSMAYWNKDWKPGPYPKTEKERLAAAKKYNLVPQDYKPYPDDGMGYGDYPMLPYKCSEARDPNEIWDIPHVRRNYGEPMHVDADILSEDRWSPDVKKPYSYSYMLLWLVGGVTITMLSQHLSPKDGYIMDLKPKQLWQPGVTHYSFDFVGAENEHKKSSHH